MAQTRRFAEYGELLDEVARLRERGDAADALALIEAEGPRFPGQIAYVHLWRMSLNVALGRIDRAILALEGSLAAGCRYPAPMLRDWPAIAPLREIVEFERLMHIAAMRYDAELAASRPRLTVERPDLVAPPSGLPLLVALHGNNATAEQTLPLWRGAAGKGVVVAAPGSAEIALTPGFFVWNDAERTHVDVVGHVERLVREQRIDPSRIVLGGFSAGAWRALQIAYGPAVHARAAIVVGPWLPLKEIDPLVAARPVRTFIAVGERDRSGYDGARTLAQRLEGMRVPVRLAAYPELGHAYPPDWDSLIGEAIDFALAG